MKIACISFTDKGLSLGDRIARIHSHKYRVDHFPNSRLDQGVKGFLKAHWKSYHGFIFIAATGIAIRLINPYIEEKSVDPAVVVLDDMGRFSISLLSGHLGGANDLAKWLGENTGALPIITTASDNRGIESLDIFAKANNYSIEDMASLGRITSMMVNGKSLGFYSNHSPIINYPRLRIIKDLDSIDSELEGAIIVSSKAKLPPISAPHTLLRPRNINIGLGCRKGISSQTLIEAIKLALGEKNLSPKSIKSLASVELKKDEEGLIRASKYFKVPLEIFSLDQVRAIEDNFQKSQFVKDTIGVYSVSEPCAYLLGGRIITRKARYKGVTISISIEEEK